MMAYYLPNTVYAQPSKTDAANGEIVGKIIYKDAYFPYSNVCLFKNKLLLQKIHADSLGNFYFHNLSGGWYTLLAVTPYQDVLSSKPVFIKKNEADVAECDEFEWKEKHTAPQKLSYPDTAISQNIDSIMVIKSKREMYIYHQKQLLKIYHVSLGDCPIGAKHFEDDGKTPEGIYKISDKNPYSSYHKSLGISYPSPVDVSFAKKAHKPTGGLIRIHGLPNGDSKNVEYYIHEDWTAGCIAVTDTQIDEIYLHCTSGVPIFIMP